MDWLLEGKHEAPRYFAQMKTINKTGWPLLADLPQPLQGDHATLAPLLAQKALVIDFRPRDDFAQAYLPGASIFLPAAVIFPPMWWL